ncbi:MAG: acyl carrier protein [Bryobacteraceae bacterium]
MRDATFERIRTMMADAFGATIEQMTDDASPDTIEGWDSIQHLNLVMALEEEFGVQFEPEEIEQLLSVELVAALVAEKKKEIGVS